MADYSFRLPDLGEGTVESEIVAWRAGVGDAIEADQPLVDMLTDKATIEITAPVTGTLVSVAGEPGDVIAVGAELAVFATDGEQPTGHNGEGDDTSHSSSPHTPSSFPRMRESSEITSRPQGDTVSHWMPEQVRHNEVEASGEPAPARPQTSPAIRRLARERGVDLDRISGTGPNGRITRADIDACTAQSGKPVVAETEPDETGVHEIRLVGLRRKIAEQMSLSASRIPHFSYVEEADVTELERLRRRLNETRQEDRAELTYLPFFMQALVKVVQESPRCNAHFDDERQVIRQFDPVHIGIAVQTQNGLLVPVIRHAENLDLWQCAQELRKIAQRAREGRAGREELSGSTITITSLGALGGIVSTPIINYPEVAIIGINRTQQRQVFEDGRVNKRLVMNISSSFDHRVVDGYDAARAIHALKGYLEFPATLLLPVQE